MIHLDTSVLIDALTGPRRSAPYLRQAIERGERILLTTLVLYEWTRGRRLREEIATQEALFPNSTAIPFGPLEASVAATLYRTVPRPRGRELDIAVAACALTHRATLWTLNRRDFVDIPRLNLWSAS